MKLSILICSIQSRGQLYTQLTACLWKQYNGLDIQMITEVDRGEMSIGHKRNLLLDRATGDYLCFIDDDDIVSSDYIEKIMKALESNPDCCSLTGVITWNGERPEIFEHSIKYSAYKTNDDKSPIKYERYPNHLNVIRSSIAKQFRFPEINHGEDTDWATQIYKSGLLKTEAEIKGIIYHYQYQNK